MRGLFLLVFALAFVACQQPNPDPFTEVDIQILHQDSVGFRAIDILPGSLAFAGGSGKYGSIGIEDDKVRMGTLTFQESSPEFRSVAHTSSDFFVLSAGSPALLYKTGNSGEMELVYTEKGETVFYDAMSFWDDQQGMALGDRVEGEDCLSILITRDGGDTWNKLPCDMLPPAEEGEGAYAASNTNLVLRGSNAWIISTSSHIYHSPDRGVSWTKTSVPVKGNSTYFGPYSLDFYNEKLGVMIGGDFEVPENKRGNKAISRDGGKSWELLENTGPGYQSCIQFIPGRKGMEWVTVGYTGIWYSNDQGKTWLQLSEEGFFTLRFLDETTAYAGGYGKIAKLNFK